MKRRSAARKASRALVAASLTLMGCEGNPAPQAEGIRKELPLVPRRDDGPFRPGPDAEKTVEKAELKKINEPVKKSFQIGIIGDSMTDGVYFPDRYPDTLERILKKKFPGSVVEPYGKNGQTTKKLRARFQRDILSHNYDTVIIQGGTNDIYMGYQVQPTKENLEYMIEAAKKKGMMVLLLTVGPCHNYPKWTEKKEQRKEELNQWIRQYPGVIVADTQAVLSEGDPPVMKKEFFHKDYIHPNGEGFDAMAKLIAESIAATQ